LSGSRALYASALLIAQLFWFSDKPINTSLSPPPLPYTTMVARTLGSLCTWLFIILLRSCSSAPHPCDPRIEWTCHFL